MRTTDQIVDLLAQRRAARGAVFELARAVSAHYNNRIAIPLPETTVREEPFVPNLIAQGIDQHAMRIASLLPDVDFPAQRKGEKYEKQAQLRRQAAYGWWESNGMDLLLRKRARHLIAYTGSVVEIIPDKTFGAPRWRIHSPLDTYPAPTQDDLDYRPSDVIITYTQPWSWLRRNYPTHAALVAEALSMHDKPHDDDKIEIARYLDHDSIILVAVGGGEITEMVREAEYGIGDARIINLGQKTGRGQWAITLDVAPQLACCPVITPTRLSLDQPKGQFDDTPGMFQMFARMMSLEVNAVTRAVYPDTWFIKDPQGGGEIIRPADGMRGVVGEVQGGQVINLAMQPGFQTTNVINMLERGLRLNAAMPAELGGECVDDHTEILTAQGWKRYDEIGVGTEILTLNHDTGLSEWQPIQDLHVYEAVPRSMLEVEGKRHSSLSTLNHRWPVVSRWNGERQWRTSAELTSNHRLPIAAMSADTPVEAKWSDALVELVAWFYTEGSRRDSGGQISQSVKKPEHVERIRAALRSLFGPPTTGWRHLSGCGQGGVGHDGVPRWNENTPNDRGVIRWDLSKHAADTLSEHCPDKVPTNDWLRTLTQAQLELFLNVSLLADNAGGPRFGQKDPARSEAFAFAAMLAGYGVSYRQRTKRETRPGWREGAYTAHIVRLRRNKFINMKEGAQRGSSTFRHVIYDGQVWCPTVENGSWLARRHGSVYYTGNSGSNIRTDRRGQSVLSAAIDFHIDEHQKILARSMKYELDVAAEVEAAYWRDQPKSIYVSWTRAKGRADYKPAELWAGDRTAVVSYPFAGMDINQVTVAIGQQVGMQVMSNETAMEKLATVDDPKKEKNRIAQEAIERAVLAGFEQQVAQGIVPLPDAVRALDLLRNQQVDVVEAFNQVQKEAQDRQASSGQPGEPSGPVAPGSPEAQPGIAQPGQGMEQPTAGPQAPQGLMGMRALLNSLTAGKSLTRSG